jgi:hypothetical protein
MASKDPFDISNSLIVAPTPCVECGNNMYCYRRQLVASGERQSFLCSSCGAETERTVGLQESDDDIQKLAEKTVGMRPSDNEL